MRSENIASRRLDMKEIPIPKRMQALARDSKGRLVPFFVEQSHPGDPDFRIVDPTKIVLCYQDNLCWVCGTKMGVHKAFVSGPMCCINKTSAEPPSHYECAFYSVQVCPFLTTPRMKRREADLPDEFLKEPAGIPFYRNPGVAAIWVTRTYHHVFDGAGGFIFRMGPAQRVEWYSEGRVATRQEVMESIETGFPTLAKLAEQDGSKAIETLQKQYRDTMRLLPIA
jgi:hypothetical protein